jgi:hypothetical protein
MTRTQELLGGYDPVAEGEQDENGVDLNLLRANLKLTFEQRIAQHRVWAEQMMRMRHAAESARSRGARPRA